MNVIKVTYLDGKDIYQWVSKDFLNRQARQGSIESEADDFDVNAEATASLLELTFGIWIRQAMVTLRYRSNDLYSANTSLRQNEWFYVSNYLAPPPKDVVVSVDGVEVGTGRVDSKRIYFGDIGNFYGNYDHIDVKMATGFAKNNVPPIFKKILAKAYTEVLYSRTATTDGKSGVGLMNDMSFKCLIDAARTYQT